MTSDRHTSVSPDVNQSVRYPLTTLPDTTQTLPAEREHERTLGGLFLPYDRYQVRQSILDACNISARRRIIRRTVRRIVRQTAVGIAIAAWGVNIECDAKPCTLRGTIIAQVFDVADTLARWHCNCRRVIPQKSGNLDACNI